MGKYPQTFLSPPPLAPGNNLPNNLRILPTDVTLKHHAPDVNLNATSGHYLLDFFPGLNPPDIPDEHSPQLTPSLPRRILLICLFVCLFFFTVFLGIYKGFTARRHKNLQELYKGTLGMTCLFYSFIHWFIFFFLLFTSFLVCFLHLRFLSVKAETSNGNCIASKWLFIQA